MTVEESRDYVLQQCRQQDVKFIRLWFTDILGSLKSFAITFEELAAALEEGVGFDGGALGLVEDEHALHGHLSIAAGCERRRRGEGAAKRPSK
ncbi:MAG TPA: glutamine synthetase [Dehalococcoidia bacterium]